MLSSFGLSSLHPCGPKGVSATVGLRPGTRSHPESRRGDPAPLPHCRCGLRWLASARPYPLAPDRLPELSVSAKSCAQAQKGGELAERRRLGAAGSVRDGECPSAQGRGSGSGGRHPAPGARPSPAGVPGAGRRLAEPAVWACGPGRGGATGCHRPLTGSWCVRGRRGDPPSRLLALRLGPCWATLARLERCRGSPRRRPPASSHSEPGGSRVGLQLGPTGLAAACGLFGGDRRAHPGAS